MPQVPGYERIRKEIAKQLRKHRALDRLIGLHVAERPWDRLEAPKNISGQGHITQPTRPISDKGGSTSPKNVRPSRTGGR